MRYILVVASVMLAALFFSSCSETPTSIGSGLLSDDFVSIAVLNSSVDSVEQRSSYFLEKQPLGESNRILIGRYKDLEATALVKFLIELTDTTKNDLLAGSINVVSAKIKLIPVYQFGDSTSSFGISAHKVNSGWGYQTFTADSLANLQYDPLDLSSQENYTDTLFTFKVGTDLIKEWLIAEADTSMPSDNGIYLKPKNVSSRIIGFQALSTSTETAPKLEVVIEKQNSYIDTLNYISTTDLHVITSDSKTYEENKILIQSGMIYSGKLWFDISKVPSTAVINFAELTLFTDSVNSISGAPSSESVLVSLMSDSAKVVYDTLNIYELKKGESGYYSGVITPIVQKWAFEQKNEGLIILPVNVLNNTDKILFYGSSAIDYSKRPKLLITYTEKK